ncbi:MAG: hypothetical protein WD766_13620 [Gemmatimonadota bacterium]
MASTRRPTPQRRRKRSEPVGQAPVKADPTPRPGFWLPLVFTISLVLLSFVPRVHENPTLARSFLGAALALVVWQAILYVKLGGRTETRTFTSLLRPQHYLQAAVQLAVYLYWGYHWQPVYDFGLLLLGQLVFAYAFDMLLAWSRRENYVLGFGPFPIIFSTNLFLWFRDDWFYLQFLMLAVGFLGKEFVRWHREGKKVHIFNPSAFSLGLFSLVLIVTGTTELTWGPEIASTLTLAPRIYLFLFLVGLVVMYFFSITLVAGSAAIVLFGLSALYSAATGVPYFLDSEIPAAVFLGLHLLVTDPSTSPRTPPGKMMFGALYGVSVFALYAMLGAFGAPTFYDKLLAVPLLNLSVQRIDAAVQSLKASPVWNRWRLDWALGRGNLAYMGVWIFFFGGMAALGRTDGRHVGDSLPFWQQACEEGRPNACTRLVQLETTYCTDNSGWACNELGAHVAAGIGTPADPELAMTYFSKACELRFQAGCLNVLDPSNAIRSNPRILDFRLLLREGGQNLLDTPEPEIYARACDHDWQFACDVARLPSAATGIGSRVGS